MNATNAIFVNKWYLWHQPWEEKWTREFDHNNNLIILWKKIGNSGPVDGTMVKFAVVKRNLLK